MELFPTDLTGARIPQSVAVRLTFAQHIQLPNPKLGDQKQEGDDL